MDKLQALLDALLKIADAAQKDGIAHPNGLFGVVYDLGLKVAADEKDAKTVAEILADCEALLTAEHETSPAVLAAIESAKKALDFAKSATEAVEEVASTFHLSSVETALEEFHKGLG